MTILTHELNLATYVNQKAANAYSLKRQTVIMFILGYNPAVTPVNNP